MKLLNIFLLSLISTICFSQDSIQGKAIILHPAVGKIIDNSEKKLFGLFPEYKDSTFSSAFIIKFNDSSYIAVITNIKNQNIEKNITIQQLDAMYYSIDEKDKQIKSSQYNKEGNRKKRKKEQNN